MKKISVVFIVSILIIACSSKKEGNMIVKGQIKGLRKGTLYLQKKKDSLLVTVDSVKLKGSNTFVLTDNVVSPIMYYLTFDGNTSEKRLLFFGEKGEITITDNVEEFGFKPNIKGSKNQKVMDEFNKIDHGFKMKRLDFIKQDIEARATKNDSLIKALENDYKRMMRRKFLFTANFAISHPDTEASPYIALTELFDANIMLLDTINKSLSDRVRNSTYGKQLDTFVANVTAKKGEK